MAVGMESVVVGVAVAGAGAWAVRALVRSLKKPGGCSSCAGSGGCPLVNGSLAEGPAAEGGATTCSPSCPTETPARGH
jgi:hypothetical protein